MSFQKLKEGIKNRCLKIKAWWHDGEEWLTFGALWNFFPMIVVPVLIAINKIESPFITLAATYTMAIFSISLGLLNSAIKYKQHCSLVIFTLAFSVFLYGTIFSDPVSPKTESGINEILLVQIICLIFLTLLLIRMAFVGVKFTRKSNSLEKSDSEKNQQTDQKLQPDPERGQEAQPEQGQEAQPEQGQELQSEQKAKKKLVGEAEQEQKLRQGQRKRSTQDKGKIQAKPGRKRERKGRK